MKRFLLFTYLFIFPMLIFSQVNFTGYLVDEENNKMRDVTINLYEDNNLVSSDKWAKKFSYDLELEKYYTLELIKEGFIPKRVAISTFEGDKGADPFMFVMELLKKREGVDESDLDFPSALIEYKKSKGSFNFNVPYSKSIKKEQSEVLNVED
ncbi:hypothetical protein FRY74_04160 [Vicingus serpentipes]|uniref:Carboxypeptidase regulatory-like domain-containing protein n=1 Tax=Vicingus serpentipes TaxID=1926625 RepID=A0A5C6RUL9_9FLAO|nr:hypothetical protein [Vicingus serpentipes]TXB65767.1 hypothetical protein FRY74_04160 [Vicingus serpentipes]